MSTVKSRAASYDFIYLASQSPRRSQLLDQLGVRHELLLPDEVEDAEALEAERPGELPRDYVERVTRAKLAAARQRLMRRGWTSAPVLCSDTTVSVGRKILGKPADAAEATAFLQRLSGRTHRVMTAVALWDGRRSRVAVSLSMVRMAVLPADVLARYVESGEPFGKAGAYAVQSSIAGWIERMTGSYSGIMGLPLYETAQLLRQAGVHF